MKVILTIIVVVMWAVLILANLAAAGRTAGQMQSREGIGLAGARRRTTTLVLLWSVLMSGGAVVALVLIW